MADERDKREARLAEALRENLRRRKRQARGRTSGERADAAAPDRARASGPAGEEAAAPPPGPARQGDRDRDEG